MNLIRALIRKNMDRRACYFREAEHEIAATNLETLKIISLATVALLLFFFAFTPVVIPAWRMTPQHMGFLPASLAVYLVARLYEKRGRGNGKAITRLCILFEVVLFVFCILIDVLPQPSVPSSFFPMLCVSLPAVFILPYRLSYGLICFFGLVYLRAVYMLEIPYIRQYDIFNAVVALMFSIPVSQVVMSLRIRDHEIQKKFELLSRQDVLSDILNKKACEDEIRQYLELHNPEVTCMLIILDLDDFKQINDCSGHYTGDALLYRVGNLLKETFRVSDIIGRIGGDEFMVLIKGFAERRVLEEKCRVLQERLLQTTDQNCTLQVTGSIGGILAHGQPADFNVMFRQADDALYEAKHLGKNCCVLRDYKQAEM